MSGDCTFCSIVSKELPASVVYEDDDVMAFMDIGSVTEGHTLVIPKRHVRTVCDMDGETASTVFGAAAKISRAVAAATRCDGMNLLVANEEAAGQVIFHVHVHLIPRYVGDDFVMGFNYRNPPREELQRVAAKIRDAMEA